MHDVGDQLVVSRQHAFLLIGVPITCGFLLLVGFGGVGSGLALFDLAVVLSVDLVQVGLLPDVACVGLIEKLAHENYLVRVVTSRFTKLVLRLQVDYRALFELLRGQRLAKRARIAAQRRV